MIVVFGSINVDLVARVERIAAPGETVIGPSYTAIAGGKGANQALAARRAGAEVAMVGAIGHDSFAKTALAYMKADGVDLSRVVTSSEPTGAAFIAVDSAGQNAITVAAGANGHASAAQLLEFEWKSGDWLLLQRETPDAEGRAAAQMARKLGAKTVLNLAPGGGISGEYLAQIDVLIMNEHEALLLGEAFGMVKPTFADVAALAAQHGCKTTIVTLGAQGVQAWRNGQHHNFPARQVAVVDTTAAGDAFVGAFAAAMEQNSGFTQALQQGLAAGSLACTKPGAQPSLPYKSDIAAFLG